LFFGRCNAPIKYDFRGYFRAILNERAVASNGFFSHEMDFIRAYFLIFAA